MSQSTTPQTTAKDADDEWWDSLPDTPFPESYYKDSPLFMDPSSVDQNSETLNALQALVYEDTPDEIAENMKNQGNQLLREHKGNLKKYLPDIVTYYTRGLEQKMTNQTLECQLLANRAHAHILLENYGHAIEDCKRCIAIDRNNLKAMYRMAKAANALGKWKLALQTCQRALKLEPKNAAIVKERERAENALEKMHTKLVEKREQAKIKREVPKRVAQFLKSKNIKLGKIEFESEQFDSLIKQQAGVADARLGGLQVNEETNEVIFNVIFAYDQFQQTDFIQNFSENHSLFDHLSEMFPPQGPPIPFGTAAEQAEYTLDKLRVFYWNQDRAMSIRGNFVEVKNLKTPLREILVQDNYYLPANFIPIFHVVSTNSPQQVLQPLIK